MLTSTPSISGLYLCKCRTRPRLLRHSWTCCVHSSGTSVTSGSKYYKVVVEDLSSA